MIHILKDNEGDIIIKTIVNEQGIKSEIDVYNYPAYALELYDVVSPVRSWEFIQDIDFLYNLNRKHIDNNVLLEVDEHIGNQYKTMADYYKKDYLKLTYEVQTDD